MPPSSGRSVRGDEFPDQRRIGTGAGQQAGGARVVSADTTVRTLPDDYDPEKLRTMLTANGGEESRQ